MPTLDGVYAKLDRARIHARDLHQKITTTLGPDRYTISRAKGEPPTVVVFRAESLPAIDATLSLLLGDFLTNARAALDHLAWQLVLLDGGTPNKRTSFPILDKHPSDTNPHPILGVKDPAIAKALESVQPYQMKKPDESPLFSLNELVNIDKHRLLLVMAHGLRIGGSWWGHSEGGPIPEVRMNLGPLKQGDPLAWFDFGTETAPLQFDPHLSLELRLNDGPETLPLRSVDVSNVVASIYSTVEHTVISNAFATLFGKGPRHNASAFGPTF